MSKKNELWYQCRLVRCDEESSGHYETSAWIPEEGAVVGTSMRLKSKDGDYLPGRWKCIFAGSSSRTSGQIREHQKITRKYRITTDI